MFPVNNAENLVLRDGEWIVEDSPHEIRRDETGTHINGRHVCDNTTTVVLCGERYIVSHGNHSTVHDLATHSELLQFESWGNEMSYRNHFYTYEKSNYGDWHVLNVDTLEICNAEKHVEPFLINYPYLEDSDLALSVEVVKYYDYTDAEQLPTIRFEDDRYTVKVYDQYLWVNNICRWPTALNPKVTPGSEFTLVEMPCELGCMFEMVRTKTTTKPALRVVAEEDD